MSNIESFDDYNSTERMGGRDLGKPFAFRENKSTEGTLEWLNNNIETTYDRAYSRLQTYRRHQALFKGIHWKNFDTRGATRDHVDRDDKKPKMVQNFVAEMLESKVSQMSAIQSNITFIPNNDEQSDINNSIACKKLCDARAEEISFSKIQNDAEAIKYLFGNVFLFIEWDEDIGPIHPKFQKITKLPNWSEDKLTKKIGKSIHIGDVKVRAMGPDRVFPEPDTTCWDDVNYVHTIDFRSVEEVEFDYPAAKGKIQATKNFIYDYDTGELYTPDNKAQIVTFYHRRTKYLPNGARIVYCNEMILEEGDLPYDHGKLPFVVDSDIDVYSELWGRSFISRIEQKQRYYNNIESCNAANLGQFGRPKIVAPKGSINVKQINNNISLVEYKGAIPPRWEVHQSISSDSITVQDRLEKKIGQDSQIFDIARGEIPKGVTATSALRLLDDQQVQRTRTQVEKRKLRIIDCYKMMVQVMAQYYTPDDNRTVRILGKNNEYLIKSFKEADFSRIYDVRFQNSPDLPDSKSGRISTIVELNQVTQTNPVFSRSEVIQMLDLGLDETFKDKMTVAVNSARSIMEMILAGEQAPEPAPYDDLITHYKYFIMSMQELTFKSKVPDEIKLIVEDRITVIEQLMYERCKKNMKFAQLVMELEEFPIYAAITEPISSFAVPMQPMEQKQTQEVKAPQNAGAIEKDPIDETLQGV